MRAATATTGVPRSEVEPAARPRQPPVATTQAAGSKQRALSASRDQRPRSLSGRTAIEAVSGWSATATGMTRADRCRRGPKGPVLSWGQTPTETTAAAEPRIGMVSAPNSLESSRPDRAAIWQMLMSTYTGSSGSSRSKEPACRCRRRRPPNGAPVLRARTSGTESWLAESAPFPPTAVRAGKPRATATTTRSHVRCQSSCPGQPLCHGRNRSKRHVARSSLRGRASRRPGQRASPDQWSRHQPRSRRLLSRNRHRRGPWQRPRLPSSTRSRTCT